MNNKKRTEPSESEASKRLKQKSKEIRDRAIVPPVDEEEPTGRLSGGPEHLDLDEQKK